jgi:uncharacterized protein (DUF1778 family)
MAMTLRLSDEETEALRKAAQAEGVSMQEYARSAILERTQRWAQERDAFLTDFVKKNKKLLDRLAQ